MSEAKTEDKPQNTIKRYRLARPGDEGREVFGSDCTIAKAIQNAKDRYAPNKIDGFYKGQALWETGGNCYASWEYAVVADEAPDPGEGHRLLKKLEYDGEDELVQEGDEFFCNGNWIFSGNDNVVAKGKQSENHHYRRRIEPEKPEWAPKAGDWVKLTKPKNSDLSAAQWEPEMDHLDGCVVKLETIIVDFEQGPCDVLVVSSLKEVATKEEKWWVAPAWCSPAEPPQQQPENDLAKQIELAKAEFAKWPQWKKDLAVSVLSPKAESETPREPIIESQQQSYIAQVWDGGKLVHNYQTIDVGKISFLIVPGPKGGVTE